MLPLDHLPAAATPAPYLTLAALATSWAAPLAQPQQQLHLDCSAPPYQCPQGVCHQVSQLLLLRRAGVKIWLHQAHPLLAHMLHKLKVADLFAWGA